MKTGVELLVEELSPKMTFIRKPPRDWRGHICVLGGNRFNAFRSRGELGIVEGEFTGVFAPISCRIVGEG